MSEPLDERYLKWLYRQVLSVKDKPSYWDLFRQLYMTEFVWFVPNDDNRVEDGRDLRYEFMDQERINFQDREWEGLGCSMLEMLIGLSRRLSFEIDGEPRDWFWHLLKVLGLTIFDDDMFTRQKCEEQISEILDRVIWRTYDYNGRGGLFPLRHAEQDQRSVEIWYQLSAYIMENA